MRGSIAEIAIHRVGRCLLPARRAKTRACLIQLHDTFRLTDGQHAEQHLIHQGEDGGICADAEGQRQHSNAREDRTLRKKAKGKTQGIQMPWLAEMPSYAMALHVNGRPPEILTCPELTTQNLKVQKIDADANLLLIKAL